MEKEREREKEGAMTYFAKEKEVEKAGLPQ